MADNVIREFLVSLGFETKDADKFGQNIDWAQAKAVALGEAMYDAAKAVAEAVAHMATGFDQLYWQTQRLGSSAGDIKSYSYAISQLGGSAQGAQSSLESIAEFMKSSPGAGNWLVGRLGVDPRDLGNAEAVARDLAKTFQTMPYYRAKAYASLLGIDPISLQAMQRDTGKFEDQYKEFARNLGIDLDDVAGKSNEFMTNLREMKAEFGLVFDLAAYKVLEFILPKLEALSKWVTDMSSGKKITGIGGEVKDLVSDIGALIKAMGDLAASDAGQKFAERTLWAFDNVVRATTRVIKIINDVINRQWTQAYIDASTDPTKPWPGYSKVTPASAPSAPSGGVAPSSSPSLTRLADRFVARGASPGVAAGIAAGIFAEGGRPDAVNKTSGAFGIGQWLGSRKAALFAKYGPHPSLHDQIDFLWNELRGGDAGGPSVLAAQDADSALLAYVYKFMRPQGRHNEHVADALADMRRGRSYLGGANPFHATLGAPRAGVTINQQTTINANGGNSRDVANDVAGHQDSVNQRLVSNAGVFAY